MARGQSETLTAREAEIMEAVWTLGEATAEQVRERLADRSHDSTVRTLMRVLETKGYLTHEVRGKVFVYKAAIGRQNAQKNALQSVLSRFFGGSAEDLVLRLIEEKQITPEQLEQLRRKPETNLNQDSKQGDTHTGNKS